MRAAAGLALLLAACAPGSTGKPSGELVECALAGSASYARVCSVEWTKQDDAPLLIVRHPDGGFRRFEVLDGGKSLAAADGAEALAVASDGQRVEVSVDSDRYRFPSEVLRDGPGR